MDGLTFVSEMIKAVAWPTAVVVVCLLLRRPLAALAPLLRRVKYGELELGKAHRLDVSPRPVMPSEVGQDSSSSATTSSFSTTPTCVSPSISPSSGSRSRIQRNPFSPSRTISLPSSQSQSMCPSPRSGFVVM